MPQKRLPAGTVRMISILAALALALIAYFRGVDPQQLLRDIGLDRPGSPTRERDASSQPRAPSGAYVRLAACRLEDWGGNDGDSFRVRLSDGRREVFRLYFVDTPETSLNFPDRVGYQAKYFRVSRERAVSVGQEARQFSRNLLGSKTFAVFTRWERVMSSNRYHAFVEVDGRWLSELLVENGLARIYTMPADLPDGTPKTQFKAHLRRLEATARSAQKGAWD